MLGDTTQDMSTPCEAKTWGDRGRKRHRSDNHKEFKTQCPVRRGRALSELNQRGRKFHYRDWHTFISLYKQYVQLHLEFSAPAWSPWLTGDIEKLEKVQKKAVKMGAGLRAKDYREKCTELGLETLEEKRQNALLHLIWGDNRVMTRQAAAAHGLALAVKYARTDTRKYSFSVRVVDPWNHLPDTVKTAPTKEAFKRELKHSKL